MLSTATRRPNSTERPVGAVRHVGGRRDTSAPALPLARALALALFAATAILLPACSDDDDPTPPGCTATFCAPYLELTSPGSVLVNLKLACESRDAEMYALLFAPDFVFEFSPGDVALGNTPANWPLPDELDSAENMFNDPTVDRVELASFIIPAPRAAVASDSLPTIEGIQVVTIDAVRLSVFTRNGQGEVLELLVPGELQVFFFRQDTVDGELRWRLVRWRDMPTGGRPSAGSATDESTWGQIKYRYLIASRA